jgi:hypothetical protein
MAVVFPQGDDRRTGWPSPGGCATALFPPASIRRVLFPGTRSSQTGRLSRQSVRGHDECKRQWKERWARWGLPEGGVAHENCRSGHSNYLFWKLQMVCGIVLCICVSEHHGLRGASAIVAAIGGGLRSRYHDRGWGFVRISADKMFHGDTVWWLLVRACCWPRNSCAAAVHQRL